MLDLILLNKSSSNDLKPSHSDTSMKVVSPVVNIEDSISNNLEKEKFDDPFERSKNVSLSNEKSDLESIHNDNDMSMTEREISAKVSLDSSSEKNEFSSSDLERNDMECDNDFTLDVNESSKNNDEICSGILLGYRIVRDFATSFNSSTPKYFVGVICEYHPPSSHSIKRLILPSWKKNRRIKLDKGLYRVRYLDNDKEDMSPECAYNAAMLYQDMSTEAYGEALEHVFEKKYYPNPYVRKIDVYKEECAYLNKSIEGSVFSDDEEVRHEESFLVDYGLIPSKSFQNDIMIKYEIFIEEFITNNTQEARAAAAAARRLKKEKEKVLMRKSRRGRVIRTPHIYEPPQVSRKRALGADAPKKIYRANCRYAGKSRSIGYFATAEEASKAKTIFKSALDPMMDVQEAVEHARCIAKVGAISATAEASIELKQKPLPSSNRPPIPSSDKSMLTKNIIETTQKPIPSSKKTMTTEAVVIAENNIPSTNKFMTTKVTIEAKQKAIPSSEKSMTTEADIIAENPISSTNNSTTTKGTIEANQKDIPLSDKSMTTEAAIIAENPISSTNKSMTTKVTIEEEQKAIPSSDKSMTTEADVIAENPISSTNISIPTENCSIAEKPSVASNKSVTLEAKEKSLVKKARRDKKKLFRADCRYEGKTRSIGYFDTHEEATKAKLIFKSALDPTLDVKKAVEQARSLAKIGAKSSSTTVVSEVNKITPEVKSYPNIVASPSCTRRTNRERKKSYRDEYLYNMSEPSSPKQPQEKFLRGIFQVSNGKFRVQKYYRGKTHYLGTFSSYEEAKKMKTTFEDVLDRGIEDITEAVKQAHQVALGIVRSKKNKKKRKKLAVITPIRQKSILSNKPSVKPVDIGIYRAKNGKFRVEKYYDGKIRYLGSFNNCEEARQFKSMFESVLMFQNNHDSSKKVQKALDIVKNYSLLVQDAKQFTNESNKNIVKVGIEYNANYIKEETVFCIGSFPTEEEAISVHIMFSSVLKYSDDESNNTFENARGIALAVIQNIARQDIFLPEDDLHQTFTAVQQLPLHEQFYDEDDFDEPLFEFHQEEENALKKLCATDAPNNIEFPDQLLGTTNTLADQHDALYEFQFNDTIENQHSPSSVSNDNCENELVKSFSFQDFEMIHSDFNEEKKDCEDFVKNYSFQDLEILHPNVEEKKEALSLDIHHLRGSFEKNDFPLLEKFEEFSSKIE